jgi:hypothetical protein
VPGEESSPVGAREEAEVLGLGLGRHGQTRVDGEGAHLGLGHLAEGKAHPGKRLRLERRQHVGLVLGLVSGDAQQRAGRVIGFGHPGVVAGREGLAAQARCEVEHRVKADLPVAAHARIGRFTRRVAGDERVHDPRAELGPKVDCEVGHPQGVRESSRLGHGGRRAAAALGVVLLIAPQLERHRDGFPGSAGQQRRDCAVDAT